MAIKHSYGVCVVSALLQHHKWQQQQKPNIVASMVNVTDVAIETSKTTLLSISSRSYAGAGNGANPIKKYREITAETVDGSRHQRNI